MEGAAGALRQVGALRFDLGERHAEIVIRDVQVWAEESDGGVSGAVQWEGSGRFLQYVDMGALPLWLAPQARAAGSVNTCFSSSRATSAYFNTKLRDPRRGIAVVVSGDCPALWLFFREDSGSRHVRCCALTSALKDDIDSRLRRMGPEAGVPGPEQPPRTSIDDIVRKSQSKIKVAASRASRNIQINDRKLQFNETLSRLILGGLRLRGIPNTQNQFQRLYKMTFDAAEFAHRDELRLIARGTQTDVPFEQLQETVEVLLRLFTRS